MKKTLLFSLWLIISTLLSTSVFGQTIDNLNCSSGTISNNQMIFNTDNFIITHSKSNGSSFASYSPWRVYINNEVNFKASTSVLRINKVVINTESDAYATAVLNAILTQDVGDKSISTSGKVATITFTGDVKEFKIKPTSQTRWLNIGITYELLVNQYDTPFVFDKTITGTYGTTLTGGDISFTGAITSWFSPTGNIPTGITFDNGVFSGTPSQAGTFVAYVKAENQNGVSNEATVTFNIAKTNQTIDGLINLTGNIGETYTSLPLVSAQGMPITYTSNSSNVTVEGNVLNYVSVGNATITATAIGDSNYDDINETFQVRVVDPNAVAYNGQGIFKKITSVEDVTDGYYVVTNETGAYLMTNSLSATGTKYLISANSGVINNSILNPSVDNVWLITTAGDAKTIYNEVIEKYVGWTSGNSASLSDVVSDNYKWKFTYTSNKFNVNNVATSDRQLSYNSGNPRFAAYGNADQQELWLFKLVVNTTWDGVSWSNGLPTADLDAIIVGDLELTENVSAKSITVENGGSLTVKSGSTLTVKNAVINNATADKFVVEAGANLVQVNPLALNRGDVTILQNSKLMHRNDMSIWSSPVTGQFIKSFSQGTLYNRFWKYNEAETTYTALFASTNDADIPFEAGKGIAIRVRNTLAENTTEIKEGKFIGQLNNGNVTLSTTKEQNGYNLIGNPYASNIALDGVDGFFAKNPTVQQIFIWTPNYRISDPLYGNNYITVNRTGATGPTTDNPRVIAPGQGFFVKVTEGTDVVIDNAMRVGDNGLFYRNQNDRFWLKLSNDSNAVNTILLAYVNGATDGFDNQFDANSVETGAAKIYSIIDEEKLSIQARQFPLNTEDVVALGFKTATAGEFSISLDQVEGIFVADQNIFIKDNLTNTIHDLSASAYTFTSQIGEFNSRFKIIYSNRTLNTVNLDNNIINVYQSANKIVVKSSKDVLNSINVYNVAGQKVFNNNQINSKEIALDLSKGVYIINVQLENGKTLSQKVILK